MKRQAIHVADPGVDIETITPSDSDSEILPRLTRALLIGEAGNIKVKTAVGEDRIFYAVPGVLPLQVSRVYATDTADHATRNIAAIY